MDKKVFIVGQTNSGKDYITKLICSYYNLKSTLSYTTRPIRECEENYREHIFITDEEADNILKNTNNIIAYTEIVNNDKKEEAELKGTTYKGYRYFATKQELDKSDIYIIDPNGINYIKSLEYDIDFIVIYIDAPYRLRRSRALNRGDNMYTFDKRCDDEFVSFNNFKKNKGYDYLLSYIDNTPTNKILKDFEKIFIKEGIISESDLVKE